jgi:hypothetical protein
MRAARKNAEELISQVKRRDSHLKLEQQQRYEAIAAKTKRLRDLRLAKEAEDKKAAAASSATTRNTETSKPKRSRQT